MDRRNLDQICMAQINLQGARVATAEILQYSSSTNIDLVLLQEPYSRQFMSENVWRIPGVSANRRCVYVNNEKPFSAILVNNQSLDVLFIPSLSSSYIVTTCITYHTFHFYVVSVYWPPRFLSTDLINNLSRIATTLTGKHVIYAGDFNGKSHLWHSGVTDERGTAVEEFIASQNIIVINQPSFLYTFSTDNGESNIDLTLSSASLSNRIKDWQVIPDKILSDHRLISFYISLEQRFTDLPHSYRDMTNFNKNKFVMRLRQVRENYTFTSASTKEEVDSHIQVLTNQIYNVCLETTKTRKARPSTVPWWTDKLDKLKKKLIKQRKFYQRTDDVLLREVRLEQYKETRRHYKRLIKTEKRKSWCRFVENDLSKNPWGFVHKLASNKLRIAHIPTSIVVNDAFAIGQQEHLEVVLNKLMPDDDLNSDLHIHHDIRQRADIVHGDATYNVDFQEKDLELAVQAIAKRKAPGLDNIRGEVLLAALPIILQELLSIFRSCLTLGYFPRAWKQGKLVTLLKSREKDPSDPKSLRPITLLSEFGKLLERLILIKLFQAIPETDYFSDFQFGFRQKRSTIDAIKMVLENTLSSLKHNLVVFVDISGAFDNLWWPSLLVELHNKNTPSSIHKLIRNYLADRSVQYNTQYSSVIKQLSKGCPQGSVLGPSLWNVIMDSLLRHEFPNNCQCIAYADDIAITVSANNRTELEELVCQCLSILQQWADRNKLTISTSKTKYMLINSKLARNPVVRFAGSSISRVTQFKYLGILVDDKLSFISHICYITGKAKTIFSTLRRLIQSKWGLSRDSLVTIYRSAIIPILSYGVSIWAHRLTHSRVIQKLSGCQALCLRTILGAYVSTPNDSLCVLAQQPPLHILLMELNAVNEFKQSFPEIVYANHVFTRARYRNVSCFKATLANHTISLWQEIWDASSKGRLTYELVPDITSWLNIDCVLSRTTLTLFTSHGEFAWHLHRIGKSNSNLCHHCSNPDTPSHRILRCPAYAGLRNNILTHIDHFPRTPEEIVPTFGSQLNLLADFSKSIP